MYEVETKFTYGWENVFWDNEMLNAISVHSEQEITNEQAKTLQQLGLA